MTDNIGHPRYRIRFLPEARATLCLALARTAGTRSARTTQAGGSTQAAPRAEDCLRHKVDGY
jgi:hypothetical protein